MRKSEKRYEFKSDIFTLLFLFIVSSCLFVFVWYILWRPTHISTSEIEQRLESIDVAISDTNQAVQNCLDK